MYRDIVVRLSSKIPIFAAKKPDAPLNKPSIKWCSAPYAPAALRGPLLYHNRIRGRISVLSLVNHRSRETLDINNGTEREGDLEHAQVSMRTITVRTYLCLTDKNKIPTMPGVVRIAIWEIPFRHI